jgi:hypothetical protein
MLLGTNRASAHSRRGPGQQRAFLFDAHSAKVSRRIIALSGRSRDDVKASPLVGAVAFRADHRIGDP